MRGALFIISTALIVAAIVLVFNHKGRNFAGLELNKKWVIMLIIGELVLLILCVLDYYNSMDPEVANSLGWHNLISYYRGSLPLAGLMNLNDFPLKSPFTTGVLMFIGALLSDYVILKIASFIKTKMKK